MDLPVTVIDPDVTTDEANAAKAEAARVTSRIELTIGKNVYPIGNTRLRGWVTFAPTADGGYRPIVDTAPLTELLEKHALEDGEAGRERLVHDERLAHHRRHREQARLHDRRAGHDRSDPDPPRHARRRARPGPTLKPALTPVHPALTTEEAIKIKPKMRPISQWTTYFPITEKNGFGANIWIPALTIDGYVVGPREEFSFWKAVGPVSRANGYKQGGAIINGRTEPQGALAGGICSCSTTLFNAALRAGFEMGARRNHYYYIDRYPLGLDATVFQSGSGPSRT